MTNVTSENPQGEGVARKIGAVKFLQCSAMTGEGMKDLFGCAALISTMEKPVKAKGGVLASLFTSQVIEFSF
jgi:hypothetical protein